MAFVKFANTNKVFKPAYKDGILYISVAKKEEAKIQSREIGIS